MQVPERSLILAVGRPYDFVPDGETESKSGCKMFYVGAENIGQKKINDDKTLGYFPQKVTMPFGFYEIASQVGLPCYADVIYEVDLTAKGAEANVVDVKFITK